MHGFALSSLILHEGIILERVEEEQRKLCTALKSCIDYVTELQRQLSRVACVFQQQFGRVAMRDCEVHPADAAA